jgi:hypothetical protein
MVRLRRPAKLGDVMAARGHRHAAAWGLALLLAAASAGCGHVAAYERGAIARPDMTMSSDLSGRAAEHVTAVHEGATRSGAVTEAGCGCN